MPDYQPPARFHAVGDDDETVGGRVAFWILASTFTGLAASFLIWMTVLIWIQILDLIS